MMKNCRRLSVFAVVFCLSVCIVSCDKKKQEGKVVISAQEFILRQDKENSYIIDAKGKVKNVGEVDLKNVIVTGYCRSCGEEWVPGRWFVGAEKTPEQKAVINSLPVGNEMAFGFMGVADIYLQAGAPPPSMPDKLEMVVESFEPVEQ